MSITDLDNCDLVLYTNPMSRGQIARWMLEEIEVPYRQELLEYGTTMKSPDYLKINPMGKVPAITHKGRVVTECAAICAYLADAFPEAGLAPALPDRADYYRWLFFAAGPLESAVTNQTFNVSLSDEQQKMAGYGSYERTVEVLAKAVTASKYIAGEQFTAADVYVGSHIIWGMQFGTITKRTEFEDYVTNLVDRPAFIKAKEIDASLNG